MGCSASKSSPDSKNMTFDATKVFSVLIQYCGESGYEKNAEYVTSIITKSYPNAKIKNLPTSGKSGKFEIYINSQMIHTKTMGDGLVTESTSGKFLQKVKDVVEKAQQENKI